jgi:hypothetical protein
LPTSFIARQSKVYPNWDFWFENRYTIWQPCSTSLSAAATWTSTISGVAPSDIETIGVARWFIFKQKNPKLGKFLRGLHCKMLKHLMTIRNIRLTCSDMFVMTILCSHGYFSGFGIMHQEKSGNPGDDDIGDWLHFLWAAIN